MVFAYLAVGLVAGSTAAILAALTGYSIWGVLGLYVLANHLGLLLAVLIVALRRPEQRSQSKGANSQANVLSHVVLATVQHSGAHPRVAEPPTLRAHHPLMSPTIRRD